MQRPDGKMHNWLGYDRKFLDEIGSEDCMGRTIWACGQCLNSKLPEHMKLLSKDILDKVFRSATEFTSPRAKAFAIMGLYHYHKAHPEDQNIFTNTRILAGQLNRQFEQASSKKWEWFEPYLTYANSRLPHSLFLAYDSTREPEFLETAVKSMDFLITVQSVDGLFVPVGNNGWYKRGGTRALYDQQSVEAASMTEAAIAAYLIKRKKKYLLEANKAFKWFFGQNLKGLKVYYPQDGSCYDGITPYGLNLNKGAESTVSFLQARIAFEEYQLRTKQPERHPQLRRQI
jgi:hypothetical protein